ncbi:Protein CBR-NAS-13-like protein, partial [Leptotrombidium deliense]
KTIEDKEYIHIYNGGGCFACVGRWGQYVPVSLGGGCKRLVPAVHLIMHSLGVRHTQSRSDRDMFDFYSANDPNQKFIDTYEKDGLSENDIKALNKLYKCERYGPQFAYDN